MNPVLRPMVKVEEVSLRSPGNTTNPKGGEGMKVKTNVKAGPNAGGGS
jgi:hypothetical protein